MTSQKVDNNRLGDYDVTTISLADGSRVQSISAILPFISKVDVASATVTYTGYALRGTAASAAGWFIMKTEVSGNVTSVTFASLPFVMDQIWDNRAGLSYA